MAPRTIGDDPHLHPDLLRPPCHTPVVHPSFTEQSLRETNLSAVTDLAERRPFLSAFADLSTAVDLADTAAFTVDDNDDDDPVLLTSPDGFEVDTWREGYPYDARMPRDEYEMSKRLLQIELLKLQNWSKKPAHGTPSCSKDATLPARAERSNDSWSTSILVAHGSSHWRSRRPVSRRSGTSSAMCSTFPRPGNW